MKISSINFNSYNQNFKANYSKENNVAILGSSKATSSSTVLDAMDICSQITKELVLSGKNIITGCGSKGIMGSAYYTAAQYSTKNENGTPEQNVVILKKPFWGDEDFENCTIFGSEKTEAARIERFIETSDSFIIFPGGPGTIQEASTIISNNYYNKENTKKVILVGSEYFNGLHKQYCNMYKHGLISCEPEKLYTIVDEADDIIKNIE